MRTHLSNLAKYFVVGGTAAVFDLGIYTIFAVWLPFNYLMIGGIGFLVGTAVNYVLCVRLIYQSGQRFSTRGEIIGVYVVGVVGLSMHQLILYLAHESFALSLMVSKILAMGLVFFWNFGMRNFYVFASPKTNAG